MRFQNDFEYFGYIQDHSICENPNFYFIRQNMPSWPRHVSEHTIEYLIFIEYPASANDSFDGEKWLTNEFKQFAYLCGHWQMTAVSERKRDPKLVCIKRVPKKQCRVSDFGSFQMVQLVPQVCNLMWWDHVTYFFGSIENLHLSSLHCRRIFS